MAQGGKPTGTIAKGAFLLLADTWGEKKGSWPIKKHFIMKGTVLEFVPNNDGKPGQSYHVHKSDDITLHCCEDNVLSLTDYEFKLLRGMKTDTERYQTFVDGILEWVSKLKLDDMVYVAVPSQEASPNVSRCQAVIRWIGVLPGEEEIKFGLEITEKKYARYGYTNGFFQGKQLFVCLENTGMFASFDKLFPIARFATRLASQATHSKLPTVLGSVGTRLPIQKHLFCPRDSKPEAGLSQPVSHTLPMRREFAAAPPLGSTNISVGSTIEIGDQRTPHYGTVRWIGTPPGHEAVIAGIEMEEIAKQCGDGYLDGVQYFKCSYGRAYFCPLMQVRPDQRLADSASPRGLVSGNPLQVPLKEPIDQQVPPFTKYLGDRRGIQGYQKSCYLDTTLFGLFALSDVFDEMFLEVFTSPTIDQNRKAISEVLWKEIVNPLRKNGAVRYESVVLLSNQLDELRKVEGITEKKFDPKDCLNMLFKHMLQVPAFVLIRQQYSVESDFFVQLSVDPNLTMPSMGKLLKRMFKEELQVSFTKIPSKLLLQVLRISRELEAYKIIPDLRLNILELTDIARVPECIFCGGRSSQKCLDCSTEFSQAADGYVYLCSICGLQTHTNKRRKQHKLHNAVDADRVELYKLDLLSVICKCPKTSHYVCFTRDLNTDTWLFFDSMASGEDAYYIPKVTDCTRELNEWVYSGDRSRLMSTQPRQLPELVRRFTQDIYMCVYIQPDIAMYGDDEGEESLGAEDQGDKQPSFKQQEPTDRNTSPQERDYGTERDGQQRLEYQHQIDYYKGENQMETRKAQFQDLQHKFVSAPESSVARFTKFQIPSQDQDSWNVQRREVVIREELGCGAWGSVHKGTFRGKQVAVKKAHRQILHENTIEQFKREIRIMAHVQHPNLVRLIAAVVDEGVERQINSPLLVLELLDTDLRSAYKKKVIDLKKDTLVTIFRDVAYALHYLHEHQEPIIHRDVSAPNVLLQQTHHGVWRAKLSDFGSANLVKDSKTPAPGAIIYSAPETFPPVNPYDPLPKQTTKIDVYSYGYLLTESIAKEMPSPVKRATMLSRIKRKWAPMHDIIIACTNKEPERRLTMTQVLEKLHTLPLLSL